MKTTPTLLATLALSAGLLAATGANATQVSINNYSFESNVLADGQNIVGVAGWSGGGGGVFNPSTASFTSVPDGVNTLWLNGGFVSQTLSTVLTANVAYTLKVDVGDRIDWNTFPGYRVYLLAGTTILASESSLMPNNGFLTSTINYTALAGNPLLGTALTIKLSSNGTQVNFDNVRLDATTVPIPAAAWLLGSGLLGLIGVSRRKAV